MVIKLKSASCQIAYWDHGHLRIANFLTRRQFAANPVALDLIRFFFVARTIRDALVEFRSYERESVAESIIAMINAELLLEHGSIEARRDELVGSSWKSWLPEGSFHFMTKDATYRPRDSPGADGLRRLPSTPAPPQFKTMRGVDDIQLNSYRTSARPLHRDSARPKDAQSVCERQGFFGENCTAFTNDLGGPGIPEYQRTREIALQNQSVRRRPAPGRGVSDGAGRRGPSGGSTLSSQG